MPFRLPTRITIAPGSIDRIPETIAPYACERVLLVVDRGLLTTPWPDLAVEMLRKNARRVYVEDEVAQNPRYESIDAIAERARDRDVQLLIGLGGGSVLDAAKAVAMLLKNPGSVLQYEGKNLCAGGSAPFIAIPTTCGTGSEVTWVSVITHTGQQHKLSVKGDAMFPDAALVDPDLLTTLPAHLIACTGMDALTHALEAYTANCANPISDALAEKAIQLLIAFLPRFKNEVEDAAARFQVMRASTLAGMAFGNADVGAVHCLSETIGGIWDVPHGLANAILLGPVMRFHEPVVRDRLAALFRLIHPVRSEEMAAEEASQEMLNVVGDMGRDLEIPAFGSLGIPVDAHRRIAEGAVANNSNGSNPQPMDVHAYEQILDGLSG